MRVLYKKVAVSILVVLIVLGGMPVGPGIGASYADASTENEWEIAGDAGFSAGMVQDTSLYVYEGTPYVAYQDLENSRKATVKRLNGSTWEDVGQPGISAGAANDISLYVYNGTPYVAYSDSGKSDKAVVKKYNGTAWEDVGQSGFSSGSADYTSLYVYEGIPYVAYKDWGNSLKATVKMYNGSSWENVGPTGFSADRVGYTSLFVYEGTPYVAYQDESGSFRNTHKATVQKFNGSEWEVVGQAGFSAGKAYGTTLYVDKGTPYVAYKDNANGDKVTVQKFNGSNWEGVGSVGLSEDNTDYISLYVYEGIPYVAYSDGAKNNKATAKKYNGKAWEDVGQAGFSKSQASYASLYVYDGILYVSYRDMGNSYKATVMKYSMSTDSTLSDLSVNGSTVDDFASDTTVYHVELAAGTTDVPPVVGTANDDAASVGVMAATDLTGDDAARTTTVTVTAEDGSTTAYTIVFSVAAEESEYTVSFEVDGGTAVNNQTVNEGDTATSPVAPTKSGYTFDGWYTDSDYSTAFDFTTAIIEDTTLYAKWDINQNTVSFESNQGSTVDSITTNYNSSITAPPTPTKTGYTFEGWYKEAGLTNAWDFDTDKVKEDITLFAKWTLNQYSVSFNTDGGSVVASQTIDHGHQAANPTIPTKAGYSFDGWYTDSDYSTAFDFTTAITEDTTLYAKWDVNQYTVSFESNQGNTVDSVTANYDSSITAPPIPTKTGYTFEGWYKEVGLTNAWSFDTDKVIEDIILYAKWDPVAVTGVTLDQSTLTFIKDDSSETLTATVSPNNATNKAVTWSSSDTNVATIDNAGLVTPVGGGTATITVTTEDGGYTATTKVHVMSGDANLSNLEISEGTISPLFNPSTKIYVSEVGEDVTSITVTSSAADRNATVSVNGKPVASGQASEEIPLKTGNNTIFVEVTAQNGDTKTYTITVKRLQQVVFTTPIKEGNTFTVTDEQVNLLDDSGILVVEINDLSDDVQNVMLTKEQLAALKAKHATVNIIKDDVQVLIPITNFEGEGELVITLERLDKNPTVLPNSDLSISSVYEVTIRLGDKIISHFDHDIELSFPVRAQDNKKPEELKIYYWNPESKAWELVGGTYENGQIKALTNHFSIFAVFHPNDLVEEPSTEEAVDDDKQSDNELPKTATNIYNWLIIGMVFLMIGSILVIKKRRERKESL